MSIDQSIESNEIGTGVCYLHVPGRLTYPTDTRPFQVTYVVNAESCEETTLNQAFTRTGLANSSCAILPGLDHITVKCTGKNATAFAEMWGILKCVRACVCVYICGCGGRGLEWEGVGDVLCRPFSLWDGFVDRHRGVETLGDWSIDCVDIYAHQPTTPTYPPITITHSTRCDPDFGAPTHNFTLYDGCNVRIGGTLVSAFLEGAWVGSGRGCGCLVGV